MVKEFFFHNDDFFIAKVFGVLVTNKLTQDYAFFLNLQNK
jgi:hypothetical protein